LEPSQIVEEIEKIKYDIYKSIVNFLGYGNPAYHSPIELQKTFESYIQVINSSSDDSNSPFYYGVDNILKIYKEKNLNDDIKLFSTNFKPLGKNRENKISDEAILEKLFNVKLREYELDCVKRIKDLKILWDLFKPLNSFCFIGARDREFKHFYKILFDYEYNLKEGSEFPFYVDLTSNQRIFYLYHPSGGQSSRNLKFINTNLL